MKKLIISLLIAALAIAPVLANGAAEAAAPASEEWKPTKPITIIVPFGAGGSSDMFARTFSQFGEKHFGVPVVIENKSGGNNILGLTALMDAKADGYTIGSMSSGVMLNVALATTPLKYDFINEVKGIAKGGDAPRILAVRKDSKFKSLADIIETAKANPNTITYGITGIAGNENIMKSRLSKAAGIVMRPVAFSNGAEAVTAMLGGNIDILYSNVIDSGEYVRSGEFKCVAVFSDKRCNVEGFQDAPAITEFGINVTDSLWQGLICSGKMPDNIYKFYCEKISEMLKDPDVIAAIEKLGFVVDPVVGDDFTQLFKDTTDKYVNSMKDNGIWDEIMAQRK